MERLTTKADVYRAMLEYANTSYRERIPYLCHLHRVVVDRGNVDERASDGVLRDIQRLVDALGGAGVLMLPPHIEALVDRHGEAAPALDSAYRLGVLYQLLANAKAGQ